MPSNKNNLKLWRCSFCEQAEVQSNLVMAGEGKASVCYGCIRILGELVEDDPPGCTALPNPVNPPVPQEIYANLDAYVVGQDRAKRILSVAVYNHLKRIWSNSTPSDVELQKANILLIGPTGSGKTLLAETLARTLDVPFAICDATSLTESGYVGEDVENILLRLIQAADWDVSRAEHGIIYIDELDKIARKEGVNRSITRDVSGEGVQQELLKIIEGCIANVPPQGGRKHPQQEFLQIDTRNILFICGGAFDGLEEIVARRMTSGSPRLGFLTENLNNHKADVNPLAHVTPEDLLHSGLIPELVGRVPVIVTMEPLNLESLVRILTEPKNAIVKQYHHLLSMDGVELEFTPEGLEAAAELALAQQTGARYLRYIIEKTLMDVMYEVPSLSGVARCRVGREAVEGHANATLLDEKGEILPLALGPLRKPT